MADLAKDEASTEVLRRIVKVYILFGLLLVGVGVFALEVLNYGPEGQFFLGMVIFLGLALVHLRSIEPPQRREAESSSEGC